ncbi:MAG: type II toxin-antitoxin system YafQ family toxin [bacterium]|nr:type II toxin-antitoxin system YafQ family toxin [bacterium]
MKLTIRRTTQFKRDIKRLLRSSKEIEKLLNIVEELAEGRKLRLECHDHLLSGKYKNRRDCHIESDWILIYAIEDDELVLYRTGSHSQLFR